MKSVYLETTVIGNIAGRIHPDPLTAARQQKTRKWWDSAAARYELFVPDLVIEECAAGDPAAARERLDVIDTIPLLETPDDETQTLVDALLDGNAVPRSEPRDATHIAIAALSGVHYLATWNFKHILNPATQHLIETFVAALATNPPLSARPNNCLRHSMIPDPTAEIKRIRHELGAEDGFDVSRILDRLRRMRAESGRTYVRRSPRKPSDNKAVNRSTDSRGN